MSGKRRSFLFRNGLSVVLLALLSATLVGQVLTGHATNDQERAQAGLPPLGLSQYLRSDHFLSATFENWESEFLQMMVYVLLTIRLYQVGSSESKDPDKEEEVDRAPVARPDAPDPVKRGGWRLAIYQHSLSIAFGVLFLLSFALHLAGSHGQENDRRIAQGEATIPLVTYLASGRFWFESFQNWQSEFMAVLSIVVLSIHLRQRGSPESKPVDAPHGATGK